MSHAPAGAAGLAPTGTDGRTTVSDDEGVQRILDAFDDADCRAILEATSTDVLSASEISDACDLPLSTTYRKLDLLTDAGLVEERTRLRRSGKHASEYARLVESVTVSLDEDGRTELQVSWVENVGRSVGWSD
jgi:DNA-binding transcriptional ArsR family regulator